MKPKPRYKPGDFLRNTHLWARNIPPYPVENVFWDDSWQCYIYGFPGVPIMIEEHMLELTDAKNP